MAMFTKSKVGLQFSTVALFFISISTLAAEKPITCSEAIKNAEQLNADDLWDGAIVCAESDLKHESSFLLIAGQIRAMTDMSLLQPISDEEGVKASNLYGNLYYPFGGSGFDEINSDSTKFKRLSNQLESWTANLNKEYNPGWQYKIDFKPTYYDQMIECQKRIRIDKLSWYASLAQNDKYHQLDLQLNEILDDNGGLLKEGTDAYIQHERLLSEMNEIPSNSPIPNGKPKECDFIEPFKPNLDLDPNAIFKQVYTGYNGPMYSDNKMFESEGQIRDSWLSEAMKKQELDSLLRKVDFNKQVIVSLAVGKQGSSATGTIHIADVKFNAVYKIYSASVLIGDNDHDCDRQHPNIYPFALAIADKPDFELSGSSSYSMQSFADECSEVISSGKAILNN